MENLCLELGYSGVLTDVPSNRMEMCATLAWITMLWEHVHKFNIQIQGTLPQLQPAQVNDQTIMEIFAANLDLSDEDLQHLNEIRMFKELVTIANLYAMCSQEAAFTQDMCHVFRDHTWPRKPPNLPPTSWTIRFRIIE